MIRLALGTLLAFATGLSAQEKATPLDSKWAETFQWRSIGPANMGGRVIDIAVFEKDPSTFWVATASGGLIKTTNNGITFEHQFDHESTVAIGAIDVAQTNPNIVWVGTGENNPRNSTSYGNGVYKSTDGGKTWKNMGLKESFQTGDLVIHPENPDIVYVGALGRLYGPNEERGLYKTTDGGKTWTKIFYIDNKTGIIDIAMHPENPEVLLVASYERQRDGFDTNDPSKKIAPGSGLYRTTDGGATFEKITKGLPTGKLGRIGIDWYLKNPEIIYAVIESEMLGKHGTNVGWSGLRGGNAETGAKISNVEKNSPAAKAGIKTHDIILAVNNKTILSYRQLAEQIARHEIGAKLQLEIAREGKSREVTMTLGKRPDNPKSKSSRGSFSTRLGGQVANIQHLQGKKGYEHGGVYRSTNGGESWRRINSINPRPMYFSQVRVDPNDNDHIYVLGVSMSRSKDGGKTFTPDAGRGVHADQHALWVDPNNSRHMILGCDGGLYVTYDRCENWDHLNHTALGQFYHVGVGPRRDYWVYGGLQDNGSWGAPHRSAKGSGPVNEDWIRIGGGDGFICLVDPDDPDQIYYESQNGNMARTHLSTFESARIRPSSPSKDSSKSSPPPSNRFNWKTPFILSHHNSRIYYCAGNRVFRSLDRGNKLKAISPEITLTDRGSGTALAESLHNPDVLYVGTDDGAMWGTRDGGKTWNDLFGFTAVSSPAEASSTKAGKPAEATATKGKSKPLAKPKSKIAKIVSGPRWVSSIEASRHVEGRAYVTLDAHRSDDDHPYVLVTEDFGNSWRSLHDKLPRGSTRVIREDIHNPDVLYLGTEFALFASIDRGQSWTSMNTNLPTVAIHEIAQHATSGEIIAGTHGRSLWLLDVTALRQMSWKTVRSDAHLYKPNTLITWRATKRRGVSGGARRYTGQNPPNQAEIFYSLAKNTKNVKLTIQDQAGVTIRTLEANGSKGLHRVTWDLRQDAPEKPSEATHSHSKWNHMSGRYGRGRSTAPGKYWAHLTAGGSTFTQEFEILTDPNYPDTTTTGKGSDDEEQDG